MNDINKLVNDNINLVHYYLHKKGINTNDCNYDDFYQEGCVALFKAARNYQEESNCKFSTYATKVISNELGMYFRKNNRYNQMLLSNECNYTEGDNKRNSQFVESIQDNYNLVNDNETNDLLARIKKLLFDRYHNNKAYDCLYAHYIVGDSISDIANEKHCSKANISAIILRAVNYLREQNVQAL